MIPTNKFLTPPDDLAPGTKARSSDINALKQAINAAFDKVPDELASKAGTLQYAVNTGTVANAYVVVMDAKITTLVDGLGVTLVPMVANTGASTLNVNGLGNIAIKRYEGTDLAAGDLMPAAPIRATYNKTANAFFLPPLAAGQVAAAAASAQAAAGSATAASNSAQSSAGSATAANNSAQSAATAAALAASWSTSSTPVDGTYYGARYYALSAAQSASNASTSAGQASTSAQNAAAAASAALASKANLAGDPTQDFAGKNVSVSSINTGPLAGYRNFVINGNCSVTQRGQVAILNGGITYGGSDRIFSAANAFTTFTGSIERAGTQGLYTQEMRVSGTGGVAGSNCLFGTRLEAADTAVLNGKTVTFSAFAYQDIGTPIPCLLQLQKASGPNGANDFSATTTLAQTQFNLQSSTRVPSSLTVSLNANDATNGLQLVVLFKVDTFINNNPHYFQAGNWQLEIGSVVTPLEVRPLAVEYAACLRYYQALSYNRPTGITFTANGDTRAFLPFKAIMRTVPTMTVSQGGGIIGVGSAGTVVNVAPTFGVGSADNQGWFPTITNPSILSPCGSVAVWGLDTVMAATASAEL